MKLSHILTIILIIVLILAVIAFIGFAVDSLSSTTTGQTRPEDKFELFRDLLLVLLALAGLVGAAVYHLIKHYVTEEVMKEVKEAMKAVKKEVHDISEALGNEISDERGKGLIEQGLSFYKDGDLDTAIQLTRPAISEKGLHEKNRLMAKSNLAYYLAKKFIATRVDQYAKEALGSANEVYEKYNPMQDDYNFPEWVETWVFVKIHTTKEAQERQELLEKIKVFLTRDDLRTRWELLEEDLKTLESLMAF